MNSINAIASNSVAFHEGVSAGTLVYNTENGKILDVIKDRVCSRLELQKMGYHLDTYNDVSPFLILPGLVDSHVHLNEPGRTEWEGFETGTKAAVSGGVTTVIDMPLNAIPPTTTVENLTLKLEAAKGQLWCDVGFWGGLVPGNLKDLKPLIKAGVRGFKGFMIHSGVDEFPAIDQKYIEEALYLLQGERTMIMFHAELQCSDPHDIEYSSDHSKLSPENPKEYGVFLSSRPDSLETNAISVIIRCLENSINLNGRESSPSVHVVHLASKEALPLLQHAKEIGLPITAETCFHYLTIAAENIPERKTYYKCCPPIRSESNRKELWKALRQGLLTSVVSDHSPCTPELKNLEEGDFLTAWGGIASVGLGLPLLYTHGASIEEIVLWCCENTSKQVGLDHRKGFLRKGYDADFAVFDQDSFQAVQNKKMYFKNKLTAYDGVKLKGLVRRTYVRGNLVFDVDGTGHSTTALGRTILERRM